MADDHMVCAFSTNVNDEAKVTRRCDDDPVPSDVIINERGQYLVVDSEAAVVRIFSTDGTYLQDAGAEHLNSAWGILQTNSGKVIISDPVDHDLKVFSKSGQFLTNSEYGSHLVEPHGIAYDTKTCRVAVADRSACCVYVHDPAGKVRDVLKVDKDQDTPMRCPTYVTFAGNGDLLVTDMKSNCVYRFHVISGQLIWVYNGEDQEEQLLSCPCGVVVDDNGQTLVADSGNCRIVAIDTEGRFAGTILNWEASIQEPHGLSLQNGRLVLTERSTGIVKVFDYNGLISKAQKDSVSAVDGIQ